MIMIMTFIVHTLYCSVLYICNLAGYNISVHTTVCIALYTDCQVPHARLILTRPVVNSS